VYRPSCEAPIREHLERGDRRAIGFHDAVRVGTLPRSTVEHHGDITTMFFNVNTADELRRAEELWNRRG
jgi:molybdopterin-guanine dinucleotide biosynthesis protein A